MCEATNSSMAPYAAVALAAFQGRDAETAALAEAGTRDAKRRGEGKALTSFQWATAVLHNSRGRYDDALAAAQACEGSLVHFYVSWSLVELVEAASRSGKHDCAVRALRRIAENASACGTDWALGIEARSRALVSRGAAAECCYREAIERLGRTPLALEVARVRLLYGGCAGSSAGETPEISFVPHTSALNPSARRRSRNGPAANWQRPASTPVDASSRRPRPSPRRRH